MWIEDKTFSVAVHYRRSREKKQARAAILEPPPTGSLTRG